MKMMFLLFATVFLLTACGRNATPCVYDPEDGPYLPDGHVMPENPLPHGQHLPNAAENRVVLLAPQIREIPANTIIRWGFNRTLYGPDIFCPTTGEPMGGVAYLHWIEQGRNRDIRNTFVNNDVETFLGKRFGVRVEGVHVSTVESAVKQYTDIFLADVSDMRVPARTIPEEMIRRYAPNYAALLDRYNGWEINRTPGGSQRALNTFQYAPTDLSAFSVYRLDVLEGYGIAPPGPLTQVAEGVYFSPRSYTMGEFLHIIDRFTYCEFTTDPNAFGNPTLTQWWSYRINAMVWSFQADPFRTFAPIFGMFGVNTGIMEEDGQAKPFFATRAFRDALIFIENINRQGAVRRTGGNQLYPWFSEPNWRIGWVSVHINDLYALIGDSPVRNPGRRYLITPPESGRDGSRGVGLNSTEAFNPNGEAWFIGENVCDDVLSRILNMFDAMSFDPRIHSVVRFGIYEDSPFYHEFDTSGKRAWGFNTARFSWEGEPYNSVMEVNRAQSFHVREGVYFTGIVDGVIWPQWFFGGYGAVNEFARSEEGRALNLLPTRTDPTGIFAETRIILEEEYGETLLNLAVEYVRSIYTGAGFTDSGTIIHTSIAETWDAYLMSLYNNGLQGFINLFSQMGLRE
jgi:hypothetical protein